MDLWALGSKLQKNYCWTFFSMPFQGHLSSDYWNHDISLIFSQILHKNCPKMVSFIHLLLNLDTCMNNLHEKVR